VPYRRKKLTFAISSPDEFLFSLATTRNVHLREVEKFPLIGSLVNVMLNRCDFWISGPSGVGCFPVDPPLHFKHGVTQPCDLLLITITFQFLRLRWFSDINISQGSVAISYRFTRNLLSSLRADEER